MVTGRPVKFLYTREEEFYAHRGRHPMRMQMKVGATRDGKLLAVDARTAIDLKDAEFLHAPIWFSTYEYRGRTFQILIDAASGEVIRGDIPPPSGGFGEFIQTNHFTCLPNTAHQTIAQSNRMEP